VTWREHEDDPWLEADRLGVAEVCRRLGWGKRKLNAELSRVGAEDAFLERIRRAVVALDPPRFMARQNGVKLGDQYVNSPHTAIDEAEAVPEHYQKQITRERTEEFKRAKIAGIEAAKGSLEHRLQTLRFLAKTQGVDVSKHERVIDRRLRDMERDLRRAA
jgi:DNA polymerase III epsilon subunit-like protein